MRRATILFADNDREFLETTTEFLRQEGYQVISVADLIEARRKLEAGGVDLAILDVRLVNDQDAKDTSGLTLAREVARTIPKIILTGFHEYARDALRPIDDLPAAVDVVYKEEGHETLIRAVRKVLVSGSEWLRRSIDDTAERLKRDYEDTRRQSRMNYIASLIVAAIGIAIIFVGTAFAISGMVAFGIASAIGGIVTEAVTYLFFRRVDLANTRMDRYHAESLQIRQFENLLAACEDLPSSEKREACKERVIDTARMYWFESAGREKESIPSSN